MPSLRNAVLDAVDRAYAGGGAGELACLLRIMTKVLDPHTLRPHPTPYRVPENLTEAQQAVLACMQSAAAKGTAASTVLHLACSEAPMPYSTPSLIAAERVATLAAAIAATAAAADTTPCAAADPLMESTPPPPRPTRGVVCVGRLWTPTALANRIPPRDPLAALRAKRSVGHVIAMPTPVPDAALGARGAQRPGGSVTHTWDRCHPMLAMMCDALLVAAARSLRGVVHSFAMLDFLVCLKNLPRCDGFAGTPALWQGCLSPPLRDASRFPALQPFLAAPIPSWALLAAHCAASCPAAPEVRASVLRLLEAPHDGAMFPFCVLSAAVSTLQHSGVDTWGLRCLNALGGSQGSGGSAGGSLPRPLGVVRATPNAVLAALAQVAFGAETAGTRGRAAQRAVQALLGGGGASADGMPQGFDAHLERRSLSPAFALVEVFVRHTGRYGELVLTQGSDTNLLQHYCVCNAVLSRGSEVKVAQLCAAAAPAAGPIPGVVQALLLRAAASSDPSEVSSVLAALAVLCQSAPAYCYAVQELLPPPAAHSAARQSAQGLPAHVLPARTLMQCSPQEATHALLEAVGHASAEAREAMVQRCAAGLMAVLGRTPVNLQCSDDEVQPRGPEAGEGGAERRSEAGRKTERSCTTLSEPYSFATRRVKVQMTEVSG